MDNSIKLPNSEGNLLSANLKPYLGEMDWFCNRNTYWRLREMI